MTKLEVNQFIEKMKMFGDDWQRKRGQGEFVYKLQFGCCYQKRTNELRQITDTLAQMPRFD